MSYIRTSVLVKMRGGITGQSLDPRAGCRSYDAFDVSSVRAERESKQLGRSDVNRVLFFWTGIAPPPLLLAGWVAAVILIPGNDWSGVLLWLVTGVALFALSVRLIAPGLPESTLDEIDEVQPWFAFEEVSPVEGAMGGAGPC